VLDLAAQAIDLDVDGALTAAVLALGELMAGHRHAWPLGEIAQQVALALGEPHRLAVALELAARDVEHELAHTHLA
jgi:hypothetical protein